MDIGKFISMLAAESLYFSCVSDLLKADPFEGHQTKSETKAWSLINQSFVDDLIKLKADFPAEALPAFDEQIEKLTKTLPNAGMIAAARFGVSCWHESTDESPAMWNLYSGAGVAIESTVEQLKNCLGDAQGLQFDRVRYVDFDNDPIEKGHRRYGLFEKRLCFSHEKEFRATLLLDKPGSGQQVRCHLDTLITAVHISPFAPGYMVSAVRSLCSGNLKCLSKEICSTRLLDPPSYTMNLIGP